MDERQISACLCLLLVASAAPIASASGPDDSTIWGISYDWSHFEGDVLNLTGVDTDEANRDIEEAADYAGFDLEFDQLLSGSSQFFVESWDEVGSVYVNDINNTPHEVTKRITELTIRHGNLADAGLVANWYDGDESIEVWASSTQETVVVFNATYTEYVDQNLLVYGADLQVSGFFQQIMGFDFEVGVTAANETVSPDLSSSVSLTFEIPSLYSEWRVFDPLDYHSHLTAPPDGDATGTYEQEYEMPGWVNGTFTTVTGYALSLSVAGIPTEEIGVDIDAFNVELSDSIADSGVFMEDMIVMSGADWGWDCPPVSGTESVEIDGTSVQAQCGAAFPVSAGMPFMIGISMMSAFDSGVQQLGDVFIEQVESWMEEAGLSEEGDDTFTCDNGEEIPSYWVNDGEEDCSDGSDETANSDTYTCDNGEEIPAHWVNDGEEDCSDGSDEDSPVVDEKYERMAQELNDSNLEKTMEAFAEKLERLVEDNVPSEPIVDFEDSCGAVLWDTADAWVVGVVLMNDGRIMLGPSITGVKDHPIDLNVEYLTGQAARDAKSGSVEMNELEEMAPASRHNVKDLYDILGPNFLPDLDTTDTDKDGTIDFFDADDDNDGVFDWDDSEPLVSEGDSGPLASKGDSGLPGPGAIAAISMLGAAAILISRRND